MPIVAFGRPTTLKDIFVRVNVKPRYNNPKGESMPCNKPRSQTRKLMPIAQTFKIRSGTIYAIKGCHICKTPNAVYIMMCNVCKKQYVGETSIALNKRMNLHRSDWKTRKFNRSPGRCIFQ